MLSAASPAQAHSVLVPMADGVRLAVDVHLPEDGGGRWPALLELTRYWRAGETAAGAPQDPLTGLDRFFLRHGYALVKVDVRGSGASFGHRVAEYGPDEVRDGHAIVEWVATQPWCSGAVGAFGTSYSGTTAELLAASGHPALKAVVPGWSDFDVYRSPARPYGLYAEGLIDAWGALVAALDAGGERQRVRPVAADADGALRAAAIAEHADNVDVATSVAAAECRDTDLGGGVSLAECSALHWQRQIEAAGVPMLVFASWLDAGTAAGALERLHRFSNPQHLVVLASCHGGFRHASPFATGAQPGPPVPSEDEQFRLRLQFFDRHLRGDDHGEAWPTVRWFHMGSERMLASDEWPPKGVAPQAWFLAADGALAPAPGAPGVDRYEVDFDVTTGIANRWATQMGVPVVLPRRERTDERMLMYTTAPLEDDLHVTGTPELFVRLTSDRTDGALLVYLEDVDPDGRSRYVTEGGLRLVHRPKALAGGAVHEPSFAAADRRPLVPGEPIDLALRLQPTSMCWRRGHRLRLAIAGADRGTFARVPEAGDVTMHVARGGSAAIASRLVLPVGPAPR
ncbi:MAG: CocE/NonD family hydrolase [Planctomycetota bacterium]